MPISAWKLFADLTFAAKEQKSNARGERRAATAAFLREDVGAAPKLLPCLHAVSVCLAIDAWFVAWRLARERRLKTRKHARFE